MKIDIRNYENQKRMANYYLYRDLVDSTAKLQFEDDDKTLIKKSITVLCPLPSHEDNNPSACVYLDDCAVFCNVCHADDKNKPILLPNLLVKIGAANSREEALNLIDAQRAVNHLTIARDDSNGNDKPIVLSPSTRSTMERKIILSQLLITPNAAVIQRYMEKRDIDYDTLRFMGVGYLPGKLNYKHIIEAQKKLEITQKNYHNSVEPWDPLERLMMKSQLTIGSSANLAPYTPNWKQDSIVFPYFRNGSLVAVRYRNYDFDKIYEKGSLRCLWGIDSIINEDSTVFKTVIIVEGESDSLRLSTLLRKHGLGNKYRVLCVPGSYFNPTWNRDLEGVENVIGIPQNDMPSRKLFQDIGKNVDGRQFVVLPLELTRRYQDGKDIVDWLKYNTEDEFLSRLASAEKSLELGGKMWGLPAIKKQADNRPDWLIENLLSRQEIVIIGAPMKSYKCTSNDTNIELSNGSIVKAGDLIGKEFEVISFDENTLERHVSKAFAEDNGMQPLVEITLQSGKVLKRTYNHPLLVPKTCMTNKYKYKFITTPYGWEWRNCENLRVNDLIIVPNINNIPTLYLPQGYAWERITSIKYLDPAPTVAICVPGDNTYITPDALEHNTFLAINIIRTLYHHEPLFGIDELVPPKNSPHPKVLFIEMEGRIDAVCQRFIDILTNKGQIEEADWFNCLGLHFRTNARLDSDAYIAELEKEVNDKGIDLIIMDPFQRLHGQDENDASKMAEVWLRLAGLLNRNKSLSIVILQHFRKDASVDNLWDSLRGSSRSGGEADIGIFMERAKDDEGHPTDKVFVRFDGREVKIKSSDGSGMFTAQLSEMGVLELTESPNTSNKNEKDTKKGKRSRSPVKILNVKTKLDNETIATAIASCGYTCSIRDVAAFLCIGTLELKKYLESIDINESGFTYNKTTMELGLR